MESVESNNLKNENPVSNHELLVENKEVLTDEKIQEQISELSLSIGKEDEIISSTTQGVNKVRKELGLEGEENDIPSVKISEDKKTKLQSVLNTISNKIPSPGNIAKVAAVSAGIFMGGNNLEAQNNNKEEGLLKKTQIENVSSGKKEMKENIEEIIVYGKRKYEEEMNKQQTDIEKYLTEMSKYQKDSAEWSQINKSYNDSLKLYEISKRQLDKMMGMVDFIDDDGKTRLTAEEIQKKIKEIDPKWDDTFGQVEHGDFRSVTDDYKGNAYSVMPDIKMSEDGQLQMNKSADNKSWASEKREDAQNFINKTEKNEIKPKFAPILFFDEPYDPNNPNYNYRAVYDKPKGTKMTKPEKPESLKTKEVKYDPKFEDLRMRSLWATILKQNPNEKIGTLHALDSQFEKGFTLEEAMSFPQEIKDQYNIDFIYNQIHGADKKPTEDYKHPGWDYNNSVK